MGTEQSNQSMMQFVLFLSALLFSAQPSAALFSSASGGNRVAVLGASGGIGQPLSMLLRNSGMVSQLKLYDVLNTVGVATDLSHVDMDGSVTGYTDVNQCLKGCDVVVICAGVARKPGMTRDDLFNINAGIARDMAKAIATNCPKASILIVTNPVNSLVPIVATVLKKAGKYDPKKLFGVTTLDVVRAKTFLSEKLGVSPGSLDVPVIGGHSGITILPLLSQAGGSKLSSSTIKALTNRIQFGGDEVVKAKALARGGSATLSMAYAAAVFTCCVLKANKGESVKACAFVESTVTDCPFFASTVELGPDGVKNIPALPEMTPYEKSMFDEMMPQLKKQVEKGIEFASK